MFLTWSYSGQDKKYSIHLNGEEVYKTSDARDRDLFIAQLKIYSAYLCNQDSLAILERH